MYRAGLVPVGEDQVAHVELTREVARRFNHIYGREEGFEDKANEAAKKMGKKASKLYMKYRRAYQEQGDEESLAAARALLDSQQNISIADRDRLFGYLEGGGRVILPEPQPLLTRASKVPGLDGQKMSKSYDNTIPLNMPLDAVEKALRTMPTDPARVRRTDPGDPANCPVWEFHEVYSDDDVREWVQQGCRSAGIGCIECKQPVIDAVRGELRPIQERAVEYENQPELVRNIINDGCERARDVARETMDEVRHAMSLD
jgi:tryptophanyl-tRNA synthetase